LVREAIGKGIGGYELVREAIGKGIGGYELPREAIGKGIGGYELPGIAMGKGDPGNRATPEASRDARSGLRTPAHPDGPCVNVRLVSVGGVARS
jgi:hypothetical protein